VRKANAMLHCGSHDVPVGGAWRRLPVRRKDRSAGLVQAQVDTARAAQRMIAGISFLFNQ
jgi:hypothetical protein